MSMTNDIAAAIARSASHNEIVRVTVADLTNALRVASDISDVGDYVETEDMSSEARMLDIWGKTDAGDEYRIHAIADLSEEEPE